MRVMIEFRARHPADGNIGSSDFRQRCLPGEIQGVTLLAGFTPQQILGFSGPLRYPAGGRKHPEGWSNRFLRDVAIGIARNSQFIRVRGEVFLKFFYDKSVDDFRFVMGDAFGKAFVKLQEMAGRACLREFWRCH